jgi:hypothetical protein
MHINALAALRLDPAFGNALAGKHERVDAVAVNDGKFQVAARRGR